MAEELPIPRKLWEHPNPQSTEMWKFKTSLEKSLGRKFEVCRCRRPPRGRKTIVRRSRLTIPEMNAFDKDQN